MRASVSVQLRVCDAFNGIPYISRVVCRTDRNIFNEILIVISFALNSGSRSTKANFII